MGKIYVLMGKSASGKDTVYKMLLNNKKLGLKPYIGYTTRPARSGEKNGEEYFFSNEDELKRYESEGRLIEKRVYHTVYGDWNYFSVDNENADLSENDYLYIGTLESFLPIRDYYGKEKVIPIYIEVPDGIRLARALARENSQEKPKYAEMCRRYLADEKDFSEENIRRAGITKRYNNEVLEDCLENIVKDVFGK